MTLGFDHAPITYTVTVVTSLLGLFRSNSPKAHGYELNSLFRGDISGLLSSHIYFKTLPQVFVGAMLMYTMRQFERQMGSRKFGAFVVIAFGISTIAEIGLLVVGSSFGFQLSMDSGPYFFIFSLIPFYHKYVPKIYAHRYSALKVPVSEKSWSYLLAIQLLLSESYSSALPSVAGLFAGYMYINDFFRLQSFRFPAIVETVCAPVSYVLHLLPFTSSLPDRPRPAQPRGNPFGAAAQPLPPPLRNGRAGGAMMPMNNNGVNAPLGYVATPPSEENITLLMNLGFDRGAVVRALQATDNNLDAAANGLLSGAY